MNILKVYKSLVISLTSKDIDELYDGKKLNIYCNNEKIENIDIQFMKEE